MRKIAGLGSLLAVLFALPARPGETSPKYYLLEAASISGFDPNPLQSGAPFTVRVEISSPSPPPIELMRNDLELYLDDLLVTRRASPAADQPSSDFAEQRGPLSPKLPEVTLYGVVPATLGGASVTGRAAKLSVLSKLEGRAIASAPVRVLSPPQDPTSLERLRAVVTSPWFGLTWLALGLSLSIFVRQRRIAALRISELEAAVQLERYRLNTLGSGEAPLSESSPPERAVFPEAAFSALVAGEVVVVTGASASVAAGLPSSRSLWLSVLDEVADVLPPASREQLQTLVADDSDAVAEPLLSFVGRDRLVATLAKLLTTPSAPSHLHRLLGLLPVQVFLDLNWDNLMSAALPKASILVPRKAESASQTLRVGQLSLLKPFGELREPESVALTFREMRRALSQSPDLQRLISTLFASRTLLFVGVSLKGLEAILSNLAPELEVGEMRHFALVPADRANELWQAGLGQRYGVQLIAYSPTPDHAQLVSAIEDLQAAANPRGSGSPSIGRPRPASAPIRLTQVDLSAIGVFKTLHLDLAPGWTLLLGDNGGGKSTLLRSIAFALAGDDARTAPQAPRLLRASSEEGSISISLGSTRLVSTLVRDGSSVRVRSPQITPLQGGQILVLAFPALRGVSTKPPTGPKPLPAADPSVDDIAPLLEGTVDGRLDNLKQWVVNIALRAEAEPQGRDARMLKTFARLITEMVPGGGVEFSRVERENFQVLLKTPFGEVPFDSISQGMSAILNWIGILLQRLYDVHGSLPQPEKGPAILLIDEIDAHLHPKWQRQLVSLTRNHFPNVQVIASSHSPLLAGAVERTELRVVARDAATGEIRADPPMEDLTGQKAEDILVSSMFALPTTRSVEAEELIRRYFELRHVDERNSEESAEYEALRHRFESLNYGPTIAQKQRLDMLESHLASELQRLTPEAVEAVNALLKSKIPGSAG